MKKSLIALAAVAASGAAFAQSSVTVFGVVDSAVTYVDGKDSWSGLNSGGNQTSRLGFRGTEDLGGGLKANFWLEGGLNADNGDGASGYPGSVAGDGFKFKRRSTVGLSGNFGEVRLGRELTGAYTAVSRYDVFGDVGVGGMRAWKGALAQGNENRKNNMVTYVSPNFSGFRATANYAFGESTEQTWKRGAYFGLGLTYDNGPLSVGFGAERQNNTLLAGSGVSGANGADVDNRETAYSLGGSYNFGVAKLGGIYRLAKNKADGAQSTDASFYGLYVSAPVGAAGEVKASYGRYTDEVNGGSDKKADHFALGYVHNLSKRTALYGTYAYLKNKNGATLTLGNGGLDNGKQQAVQVGVRHAF